MTEHGEEAAIAAVNRIRSGGVAGFFCREEFEVIVDPGGDADGSSTDVTDLTGHTDLADRADQIEPVNQSDQAGTVDEQPTVDPTPTPNQAPAPVPAQAPGTVRYPNVVDDEDETIAEAIARRRVDEQPPARLADRSLVDGPPEPVIEPDQPVFGGPVAPGSDPGRDRFLALLERRLDEASAVEDDLQLRRSRPAPTSAAATIAAPVPPAPSPASTPAPSPVSTPETARSEARSLDQAKPEAPALDQAGSPTPVPAATDRAESRPAFWRRLDRVRAELASFVPAGSPRTAVVGPLPLAAAIVHRLQATPELASAEVVALTDRAGIVSEPSWRLERNGDRLVRSLADVTDRPVIIVIDVPVDLPHWVGSLQRKLRSVGVGLFRYAVSGQPSADDLERYRQGADVPYAIDLTSRVEPSLAARLVAERHPIVSVAGADLGPELLLALRRHVGAAGLLFEPVIDG